MSDDTIFALSSGAPPAAIGVIRISGSGAGDAGRALAGDLPEPRRAAVRSLRNSEGELLDEALVLWFPGPGSATGEDLLELHCHGGRAVVAAVKRTLALRVGLREAEPGEFTRRAFANGRIDLAEAEGLADLLEAETELQRASALAMAGGTLSRQADLWREELLALSAIVEASLDFSDEDDIDELPPSFTSRLREFSGEVAQWLSRPTAERLKDGYRIVLAGPPNAGKSSLFNALTESQGAIISPHAGTTRDLIERSVAISGVPLTFVDTAGLREEGAEEIEAIGIARARDALETADCVLWLGEEGQGPPQAWEIETKVDLPDCPRKAFAVARVSAETGSGIGELVERLVRTARDAMPRPGETALNGRQRRLVSELGIALAGAGRVSDPLLVAESLRTGRLALDALVGRTSTEDMLDGLFGRFCIGK